MLLAATLALNLSATALMSAFVMIHRRSADLPSPDRPTPMPDTPTPATIDDVIAIKKAADADEQAKKDAAAKADADYAASQQATISANATLKVDLVASGPVFITDTTGAVEVFLPDASDLGFHSIKPADAKVTPVPTTPAPSPAPS